MLADAHGWRDDPLVAIACAARGVARLWRGRLDEAEEWIALAERGIPVERYPSAAVMLLAARGRLELVRGRYTHPSPRSARLNGPAGCSLAHTRSARVCVGTFLIVLERGGDVVDVERTLAKLRSSWKR